MNNNNLYPEGFVAAYAEATQGTDMTEFQKKILQPQAMTPPVSLLEDQEARLLLKYLDARGSVMALDGLKLREPLSAIATGRAKVCPVMTEAELRAEFEAWWSRQTAGDLDAVPITAMIAASAFGALARHLGLVSDAQERAK